MISDASGFIILGFKIMVRRRYGRADYWAKNADVDCQILGFDQGAREPSLNLNTWKDSEICDEVVQV